MSKMPYQPLVYKEMLDNIGFQPYITDNQV